MIISATCKSYTLPVQRYTVIKRFCNVKQYWLVKFHPDQKNADDMR